MITSGGQLLLALLDTVAERKGAELVYCDTDSAFVTPSTAVPEIARVFDVLNPYSVPCPFLKDETEEKAPPSDTRRGPRTGHPGSSDSPPSATACSSEIATGTLSSSKGEPRTTDSGGTRSPRTERSSRSEFGSGSLKRPTIPARIHRKGSSTFPRRRNSRSLPQLSFRASRRSEGFGRSAS